MSNDREKMVSQEKIAELVKLILRVGGVGVFVNLFKDAKITCNGEIMEINGGLPYQQITGVYELAGPLKIFSNEAMDRTMSFVEGDLFNRGTEQLGIAIADMQLGELRKEMLAFNIIFETKDFPSKNVFIITLPKVDGEELISTLKQDPSVAIKLFESIVTGLDEASPRAANDAYKMIISLQKRLFGIPVPLRPQYRKKEVLTGSLIKEEDK